MALSTKQQILLDLLCRSERIMRENDIKFFLFGGSTLGALRHNGFIPWDDDIDIIIDADNFYKLLELFEDGPIDNIDLVYFHNDPYWYRSFAMLVNLEDTCYTTPVIGSAGLAYGSRIDVMICDYVPAQRLDEYEKDLMLYQDLLTDTMLLDINVHKMKDQLFALRERVDKEGKASVEKELRDNLESYATGSSDDEMVVRFWTREMRHYRRDIIYDPYYHNFEGYMMPIPGNPTEQLRLQYGNDWYVIPEQEDFMFHAFYDNYDISGRNYDDDIRCFVDREKFQQSARKRKQKMLDCAGLSVRNQLIEDNIAAQREFMRADFDTQEQNLKNLAENGQYEEYYQKLHHILKVSASIRNVDKKHKAVPEMIMRNWLNACVFSGKYYDAIKLINAFELDSETFEEEFGLVDKVTLLANAYQDNNTEKMRECLSSFTEGEQGQIPECIFTNYALYCWNSADNRDMIDKMIAICESYMSRNEHNYEVMKVLADLHYYSGEEAKAKPLYDIIQEKTTNGLDLKDIEERFDYAPRFGSRNQTIDDFELMLGRLD